MKYNNLLANIAEVGRDVKPAYTNNKSSSERLRKSKAVNFTFVCVYTVVIWCYLHRYSDNQEYNKRLDGRAWKI